ncbi:MULTISPECIES: LysR family transcriptional regulator [unclassified Sporosarcina]|uniref:LysR family transcriptional regulator n=1 Tax=unclassified Sporosarcina TaxID=2647733 RepID=UPI000C16F46E|nr:LysR family transcriptional regulator [Sporosarcina sp. P2]PID26321.1 LysR family transcriptional regulator [Sporosarcina sp. P7]
MELKDFQAFIQVANHLSFTKAAEHSFISQPSLSKSVKRLENDLNVRLFNRSTRSLRLTDAGDIVYEQGKQILQLLGELPVLLEDLAEGVSGEIKIGMPPLIGTLFFPQIAKNLSRNYPQIKIELHELGAKVVEELVDKGQIDVGIIVLPTDQDVFHVQPFISDKFFLFVHHEHPFAKQDAVALTELKEEQLILFSKSFALHRYIISACKEVGFNPTISYESSQWDLIIELVAAKLGITLLPQSISTKFTNENIKMIPIEGPPLLWKLGIVTKKNSYHSFALKKFMQMF